MIRRRRILAITALAAMALLALAAAAPGAETLHRWDGPIASTVQWVGENASRMSPLSLMLLDFLQRRFNLDPAFAYNTAFYRIPTPQETATIRLYQRLIDFKAASPELPSDAPAFVRTDLLALYCRPGQCPPDFSARLKDQAKQGGYGLTHAALAYQWMQETGCGTCLTNGPELGVWIGEALSRLLAEKRVVTDLTLEALCYLHYLGEGHRIPADWKKAVYAAQQPSGAFCKHATEHATLLALWLMLEWRHPELGPTPMLRQPAAGSSSPGK